MVHALRESFDIDDGPGEPILSGAGQAQFVAERWSEVRITYQLAGAELVGLEVLDASRPSG